MDKYAQQANLELANKLLEMQGEINNAKEIIRNLLDAITKIDLDYVSMDAEEKTAKVANEARAFIEGITE